MQAQPPTFEQDTSLELCHLLLRNWTSKLEGLNLTDFNLLVLPHQNSILRASTVQRPIKPAEHASKEVLQGLSDLLGHELEIVATSQKQKSKLEKMKGYSVITLFKLLDVNCYKFLSPQTIEKFMVEQSDWSKRK